MFKKSLVVVFVLFWIVLAINPVHRGIWVLENILVVVMFPVVIWLEKRFVFTNLTFFCLILFGILHLFGAYLTYENMAYFDWFSQWLGLQRNYYDQVIHFLFGLLVFMTFYEIYAHQGYSSNISYLIAILFINSISAWYEILEWLAMELFCDAPDCFTRVTQGDNWDAQKDMLYASLGALLSMLVHLYRHANKPTIKAAP
ncbi:MAG: DUF2238 domain-containing protein [Thioalkalispiraceae bacterium]|jgi:putative membrane protein